MASTAGRAVAWSPRMLQWHLERGLRSLPLVDRRLSARLNIGLSRSAARVVRREVKAPNPHPSGARPPQIPPDTVPGHVAIVMDGNGRWAKQRGLPRTAGHEAGEASLFDCVEGAIELGVAAISAYAFSTENWRRSPDEVRFLMGFNRDVIRRRRDEMHELGVRVRWAGRRPRLWRSVIKELEVAEELTRDNDVLTLTMCVNYGGRAEIADAAAAIAREVAAGRLNPDKVDERPSPATSTSPTCPTSTCSSARSGEKRTSNFLLWQSAYAELVFLDTLWPDFDRRHLWAACEEYAPGSGGSGAPELRRWGARSSRTRHRCRRSPACGSRRRSRVRRPPGRPTARRPDRRPPRSARSRGRPGGGGAAGCSAGTAPRRCRCGSNRAAVVGQRLDGAVGVDRPTGSPASRSRACTSCALWKPSRSWKTSRTAARCRVVRVMPPW